MLESSTKWVYSWRQSQSFLSIFIFRSLVSLQFKSICRGKSAMTWNLSVAERTSLTILPRWQETRPRTIFSRRIIETIGFLRACLGRRQQQFLTKRCERNRVAMSPNQEMSGIKRFKTLIQCFLHWKILARNHPCKHQNKLSCCLFSFTVGARTWD